MIEILIEMLVMAVLLLFPTWKIFAKAGLNPLLSLLVVIPWGMGVIVCSLILIFSQWRPVARGVK